MPPKKRNPILLGKAEVIRNPHDADVPNIFDDDKVNYSKALAEPDNEPDPDVKWQQDKKHLHTLSEALANADIEVVEAERALAAAHARVGESIANRDKLKQELAAHRAKLGK